MVKRFLGDSKENETKYHKMWDDHLRDSRYGGSDKKRKYDNLAYAGYEGLNGGASDWNSGYSGGYPDWTDYNGYGGGYGYGGYGGYGYGSGNRK